MLILNIIPPKLKKEIKAKQLYGQIFRLAGMMLAAAFCYSLLFLGARILLQSHFHQLVDAGSSLGRGPENYVATVKKINEKMDNIETIQAEAIYWSRLIEAVYRLDSPGISIQRLQAEAGKTLVLKGQAAARDDLLLYKEKLEASGLFEPVEVPIQSLLSKTNIAFDLNLDLKTHDFK